eukprot:scaffold279334_cov20-Prasinocladus_malaysianus.AAC.1
MHHVLNFAPLAPIFSVLTCGRNDSYMMLAPADELCYNVVESEAQAVHLSVSEDKILKGYYFSDAALRVQPFKYKLAAAARKSFQYNSGELTGTNCIVRGYHKPCSGDYDMCMIRTCVLQLAS